MDTFHVSAEIMLELIKETLINAQPQTTTIVQEVVKEKLPSRPTFKEFLSHQEPTGNWKPSASYQEAINSLIDGGTYQNFGGFDELMESIVLTGAKDLPNIFATLLALYFLTEAYDSFESEWTLIAKKARDWLKSVGITQASNHTKLIRVRIK